MPTMNHRHLGTVHEYILFEGSSFYLKLCNFFLLIVKVYRYSEY